MNIYDEILTIKENNYLAASFYKMQSECVKEINNIRRLEPHLEDYDLPQPKFNKVFTRGVRKIESHMAKAVTFYALILISKDEIHGHEGISEEAMYALNSISERVVTEEFMNDLVVSMDLMKDAPLSVFGNFQIIKINRSTSRLILQQMSVEAYYTFCNQIKRIGPTKIFDLAQECLARMGLATIETTDLQKEEEE